MPPVRSWSIICATALLPFFSCRTVATHHFTAWTLEERASGAPFVLKSLAASAEAVIMLDPSDTRTGPRRRGSFRLDRGADRHEMVICRDGARCWSIRETETMVSAAAGPGTVPLRIVVPLPGDGYPVNLAGVSARSAGAAPAGAYSMIYFGKREMTLVFGGDVTLRLDPADPGHLAGVLEAGETFTAAWIHGARSLRVSPDPASARFSGWLTAVTDTLSFARELILLSHYMGGTGLSTVWLTAVRDENGRMTVPATDVRNVRELTKQIRAHALRPGVRVVVSGGAAENDGVSAGLRRLRKDGFELIALSYEDSALLPLYERAARRVFGAARCTSCREMTVISRVDDAAEASGLYRACPDPVALLGSGSASPGRSGGWTLDALLNAVEFFGTPVLIETSIQTLSYRHMQRLRRLIPFRSSVPLTLPETDYPAGDPVVSLYRSGREEDRWLEMDVYNPERSDVTREIVLDERWTEETGVPLTVFDIQNGTVIGAFSSRFMLDLPARDVRRMLIRSAVPGPQFLYCSVFEFYEPDALEMTWKAGDSLLSGSLDLGRQRGPLSFYYRIPPSWPEPKLHSNLPLEYQKRTGPLLEIVFAETPGSHSRIHVTLDFRKPAVSPPIPALSPI
ncbi:hypothetical protein JXO52_01550 [bacterium]|nr:hypothetical protein [bacterium]